MSDKQSFPQTWQEFARDYTFIDSEEVYTNGSKMIPMFRVEQMMEHYYEPLVAENEELRKIIEGDIRKLIADLIDDDIKETLKAFNAPKNQAAGKVFNDFIVNHQKGDNNVR